MFVTAEQRAKLGSLYDKQCAITDDYIDRVLSELDQAGALANTIVVITSDHGEAIAEYARLLGYPREWVMEGRPRELAEWARAVERSRDWAASGE